jgi:hypothetical protein
MQRTRDLLALALAHDPTAVQAMGAARWVCGTAEPDIEACPFRIGAAAALALAPVLAEYASDPGAWAALVDQIEQEAFGG